MPFSTNFKTDSKLVVKFIESVSIRNKSTAKQYKSYLLSFERFVKERYENNKSNVDKLIQQLKDKELDPYEVLSEFCIFLNNDNISGETFKSKITIIKTFLEYNDIEISPRKFKLKVKIPKTVSRHKEAIDKEDIVNILNGCSDIKLKTYVMLLAVTGARATEALSIRLKDIDFESNPAKISIKGEFTKTRVDRTIFITKELKEQLNRWIDFKYRKRRICSIDTKTNKTISKYRIPEKDKDTNNLLFSIYYVDSSNPDGLYDQLASNFAKTLDRIGMGDREDSNQNRRKITLHSFRRFAKSTISDLGYSDFSEYHIGHSGSTYWRKKDKEKAEIFNKIEPYLTFLDIETLERKGADMQTEIEELQETVKVYRNREQEREERDRKSNERLSALENRFLELTEAQDKQRKLDREVEIETDPELKDQKFDKMLAATRQTIKKQGDLERTVKETINKQKLKG